MTGFELEGYIFSGTLVATFLVKATKWILEELISIVPIYRKLKETIRGEEKPAQQPSALDQSDSKRLSGLTVH